MTETTPFPRYTSTGKKRLSCLTMVTMLIFSISSHAAKPTEIVVHAAPVAVSVPAADNAGKSANNQIYIVRFKDRSITRYEGGVAGLRATSPDVTGKKKLNKNHRDVTAYNDFLTEKRTHFKNNLKSKLRRTPDTVFDYRYAGNGMAMRLNETEAKIVATMYEVESVVADVLLPLHTDSGPTFIGASQLWDGSATFDGLGTRGEGVVIGIIDSGINSDHPSFAAVGGDGYAHINPLGSGNYTGRCNLPPAHINYFAGCNDKLIGAHDFVDATNPEEGNDGPEDDNGHGSHTASTSGGNYVDTQVNAPTINLNLQVSGVAPHASIIACDACYTNNAGQGLCPSSATTACIDALIADGVDVINYSIGGGVNPWNDSVSLGFLEATAGGIYVAASAGNSGPGASTLGHQEPWVSTTGASSHDNNSRGNSIIDLNSNGAGLGDIAGLGVTAGYGPAPIVYAGDFPNPNSPATDPAQCLQPYPSGTFSGQIVVCDRGAIARTAKGQNVLAGGAGGFVLANLDDTGESIVADSHFLPGVHIGDSDGDTLRAWLAGNTSTMASITGTQPTSNPAIGDIMASFSSRGPNTSGNVIKPDLTAPGSAIFAALSDSNGASPQFGTLSGTSMSSPHNAGSGALMKALYPAWSPYAIKSALMLTAVTDTVRKEDGITSSDPFDRGAGRIDLTRAALTGLVMDETAINMENADPSNGGDPRTLNLASMQDDDCPITCSWTRTFTSVADTTATWNASAPDVDGITLEVTPMSFTLAPGATQTVTITATTVGSPQLAWNFSYVILTEATASFPSVQLPVAVFTKTSSNGALLTKTVDKPTIASGETVTYSLNVSNIGVAQNFTLTDMLPAGADFVPGSESESVVDGTTTSAFAYNAGSDSLQWSGDLDAGVTIGPGPSPAGYTSLGALGVTPSSCPANCDDGGLIVTGFDVTYFGQQYTDGIWSVNGTFSFGTDGDPTAATNRDFPSAVAPNKLLAAFWTDLNLADGGNWYQADLTVNQKSYRVLSWENIPLFGNPTSYSFQIWMENGTENIWYVYDQIPLLPSSLSVGFENATATIGARYYYNGAGTAPAVGTELELHAAIGGTATLTFDAVLSGNTGEIITNNLDANGANLSASALTSNLILSAVVDSDEDGIADSADNCQLIANADQRDTNGDGYGNVCDPDLDNNGIVNFGDVAMWVPLFNTATNGDADFNGDGSANFGDYALFPAFFQLPPGPSGIAP